MFGSNTQYGPYTQHFLRCEIHKDHNRFYETAPFTETGMPFGRHPEAMWLVLLLIVSTVRAQQCGDAVLFQPWDDAWLVRYNKQPCNTRSSWAAFCQDSGWGDEEATVVCREQGYTYGTSDFLPAYASAIGFSHVECEGTESVLEQCSIGNVSLYFCSSVGVVTQCHNGPSSDDNANDGTKGDNNERSRSQTDSPDREEVGRDDEDFEQESSEDPENVNIGPENQSEDVAGSERSSAGVIAGVVIAAIVVVVMAMMVVILVAVLIWRKRSTDTLPARDGRSSHFSARDSMDNGVELRLGADLDNPVYGPVVEQSAPIGEPEHKFVNPLYHLVQGHTSQERAGSVSEHEYAALRTPYSAADRVIEGRGKDYSHYESEEC